MSTESVRIPLTVWVNCNADGDMLPYGVDYRNTLYRIDMVKGIRKMYPGVIGDTGNTVQRVAHEAHRADAAVAC